MTRTFQIKMSSRGVGRKGRYEFLPSCSNADERREIDLEECYGNIGEFVLTLEMIMAAPEEKQPVKKMWDAECAAMRTRV
jgi:hypothetical protein